LRIFGQLSVVVGYSIDCAQSMSRETWGVVQAFVPVGIGIAHLALLGEAGIVAHIT